jgi:Tfp pilus assembly protein PilO
MPGGLGVRAIPFLIAGALVPMGGYWGFVRPESFAAVAEKERRLDARRKDIRALEITTEKLGEFHQEVELLNGRLALVDRIRPREPNLDPLVESLRRLSGQAGLTVSEIEVLPATREAETLPIRLRLRGKPAELVVFLGRLPLLARFVRPERIEMRRTSTAFDFSVRLVAFRDRARS